MKNGHWILALVSTLAGSVFIFVTYVHATFISHNQMEMHLKQPHVNAVSVQTYTVDIAYIRTQMTEINRKLDRALLRGNR